MSNTYTIPTPFRDLANALRPVAERLRREISCLVTSQVSAGGLELLLPDQLRRMRCDVARIAEAVNRMGVEIAANDEATVNDALRAAARFEAAVDVTLDNFREICSWRLMPTDEEGRDLLRKIWRHWFREILEWLDRLIGCANDAAVARNCDGVINLSYTLTAAPEVDGLIEWIKLQAEPHATITKRSPCWGAAALGLLMGWTIG